MTKKEQYYAQLIRHYELNSVNGKLDRERVEKAYAYLENSNDDGRFGRIRELLSRGERSRRTYVAKQGRADAQVFVDGKRFNCEVKTSGGRIESLYREKPEKYVIYEMCFVQKHKATKTHEAWDELRIIEPVLIPTSLFLAKLEQFNAVKMTNGTNNERAIQVSNKRLYLWLKDYPIPYDRNLKYTADDFDGLE